MTLGEQDATLVTLARGARGRIGAAQGAAIRDEMGRTYAGATVATEHLRLSALQLAVAQAVAAGSRGAEAAVIVGAVDQPVAGKLVTLGMDAAEFDAAGMDAFRDLGGPGLPVFICEPDGSLVGQVQTS